MNTRPVIAYAGMTHLGINYAAAAAEKGFDVICYDPDEARIADLAAGRLPIVEPGLPELIQRNRGRLTFTCSADAIRSAALVYIAVDVPTDDRGDSDLSSIRKLIAAVDSVLTKEALLIVLSQVPPGFTRRLARSPERLYYQVETLVFGAAVGQALKPERFIVGAAEPRAPLPAPLQTFLAAFDCPILPMRYESAELAKISINLCLVGSIGIANTLAELCEKVGADWSEIAPSLRLDRRIGQYAYLAPGLGIAGGNLERDLATVRQLADEHGTDAGIVRASLANSAHRRDWAFRELQTLVLAGAHDPVVAILGLAYKENTHSTKNSASLALIESLMPYRIRCFDPVVPASAVSFHPRALVAKEALDACAGADALAVMTPWPAFRDLSPAALAKAMTGRIVIDPHGVLDGAACHAAGLVYRRLGAPATP